MVTIYTKTSEIVVTEASTELLITWEKYLKDGKPIMVVNQHPKHGFQKVMIRTEDLLEIREDLDLDYYDN